MYPRRCSASRTHAPRLEQPHSEQSSGRMSDRPLCRDCGKNPPRSKGYRTYADGETRRVWSNVCNGCHRRRSPAISAKTRNNRKLRGDRPSKRDKYLSFYCKKCGFVPQHKVQLHLDHIDGNRANNHPSNFQTLCANCQALKTYREKDYATPSRQEPPFVWDRDGARWIENPTFV